MNNVAGRKLGAGGSVAVAVDRDKGSHCAFRWALENLLLKGDTVTLIHVNTQPQPAFPNGSVTDDEPEEQINEILLPFKCYSTRKDIKCQDVVLEDTDIAKAVNEYVSQSLIENLVLGASSRTSFLRRLKNQDLSINISRGAPDFCNVYIISKSKVYSQRSATKSAPALWTPWQPRHKSESIARSSFHSSKADDDGNGSISGNRGPFKRAGRSPVAQPASETTPSENTSFSSNSWKSNDKFIPSYGQNLDSERTLRLSNVSNLDADSSSERDKSFQSSLRHQHRSLDLCSSDIEYSYSHTRNSMSWSGQGTEDLEAEMRRLKLELKQTMDMYSNACKEALTAKQKAMELHRWKMEEQQRLQEAKLSQEAALALAEREKIKCRAAMEAAEAAQRIAELEAQKRKSAEMKILKEIDEKKKALNASAKNDVRYRRYTIEEIEAATEFFSKSRKIGEGGYGPVYKCELDHTSVAVKVLRPDAAQGRTQFQQEVEVLSCIRHPNMVLLLGACPEYGCLVYEYMANGSLEDRLLQRGNTPPLSWQLRFRIAAEIATGLHFLHQTKPEPLVHRDLKPANILLDRNFVSKISDVGLARLVPPNVADDVTQYRMTSTAGTFCYIDPEYQQTGMLGVKSDIYSLGIMLLQIITAKPAMGLTHYIERSIDKGTFKDILDPVVPDWPVEEALHFAKLALKCAELRRKDRPDLATAVLPELNRLRTLADEHTIPYHLVLRSNTSPVHTLDMMRSQEVISESGFTQKGHSSALSSISEGTDTPLSREKRAVQQNQF